MTANSKGVIAALLSNILFSMLFLYGKFMQPLTGTDLFAWRMVTMLFGFLALLSITRSWGGAFTFIQSVGKNWRRWGLIMLPTPILGFQLWLFMWGPVNGKGIDLAMGYFLFPLAMAFAGVVIFRERISALQKLSLALAASGVAVELIRTGAFSWVTAAVFTTYPIYYLLRRWQKVPPLTGLVLDSIVLAPLALAYLLTASGSLDMIDQQPLLIVWIIALGIHSALAMKLNLTANSLLPVVVFGMLSYLEPALLFVLAITVLGEPMVWDSLISYGLVWAGIAVMLYHSYRQMRIELLSDKSEMNTKL